MGGFAAFTLYVFSDDFAWQQNPMSKKAIKQQKMFENHPLFKGMKDPFDGPVNKDDFEKGLEEAWEKAKPKDSTVTVQDKLKTLSTQNTPPAGHSSRKWHAIL